MTVWDNIYQKFNQGGEAWATLGEEIIPSFESLLMSDTIPNKNVFDIGVGTGKYLHFLQSQGFAVFGIDSSLTAVEMARKNLGLQNEIEHEDMFAYNFPVEEFGLIFSVSTIHHGMKSDIEQLVQNIYDALVPNGKIFITVPDYQSAVDRNEFENQEKLDEKTYAPLKGPEKGLAHSFYDRTEVEDLFSAFTNLDISLDEIGRWIVIGEKE